MRGTYPLLLTPQKKFHFKQSNNFLDVCDSPRRSDVICKIFYFCEYKNTLLNSHENNTLFQLFIPLIVSMYLHLIYAFIHPFYVLASTFLFEYSFTLYPFMYLNQHLYFNISSNISIYVLATTSAFILCHQHLHNLEYVSYYYINNMIKKRNEDQRETMQSYVRKCKIARWLYCFMQIP